MRHLVLAVSLLALATMPSAVSAQQTEAERRADELSREDARRRADEADAAWRERQDASLAQQRQWSAEAAAAQEENRRNIEAVRAQVVKQPPLSNARNPLLGRWVMITKAPSNPDNLTDLIVNMQGNMEILACAVIFGEDEFEYRPDALVLRAPNGSDMVADKVAYRAGKGGSVYALGDQLLRLLLFEFDAGPGRMRQGKCIYQKVTAMGGAPVAAAGATGKTGKSAGAEYKVAGVTLRADGMAAVRRDITARGGTVLGPERGPTGLTRFYAREANYRDVSAGVYTVVYDFDNEDPGVARLTSVTLLYHLDTAVIGARAAALADWDPKEVRPGRVEGKKGEVRLVLEELPQYGSVGETYLVK